MSTITTLNDGITGSSFRTQTNTNFANLNTDKAEKSGGTFTGDISVPDEAYGVGWNGSLEVPTKNAIYDKIETLGGGGDMSASTYDPAGGARQVSFACTTQTAITDYTFTGTEDRDSGYLVTTASNRTVNISPDLFTTGYEVSICKGTNNANTVTLDAGSGNNINGSQTFTLTQFNEVVTLLKDGADTWKIKSHYYPIGGTNTGDQTSIVGITGTMAQFDTAVTDGNIVYHSQTLGTPASGTLTNCTGLPLAGVVDSTTEALGVGSLEIGHATDTTISRVSAGVIAVEGVTVPTISSTSTFTNKRVQKRVVITTQSATPAINTDNGDIFAITGLAQAITSLTTNLTGTPVAGEMIVIQITDNGTARAITWGASFEASTVALPTTTVISTRLDVLFIYNGTTSKWRCIASV